MQILKHAFRQYVTPDSLDSTIDFYSRLQGVPCERRLSFAKTGIEVAVVGAFILLAGAEEALAAVRHVQATFIVDSLDEFASWLAKNGAQVLTQLHRSPVGFNVTVRHADGFIAEYFQPAKVAQG